MDATRTTTRPEAGRGRRYLAWGLLAFALGLTTLAARMLWHDLALFPLHAAAHDLRFGKPVSNAALARVIPDTLAWDQARRLSAVDLDDAAQVVSVFAARTRGTFLAPAVLATAERLLQERLALAPADGNSWLRLAYIRTARVGLDQQAHDALRMSWLATPREFSVMWPSLKFRVDHWSDMTVEEQFAAADLVAGLWHKPPERDEIKHYLANLPPQLLSTLFADMTDAQARMALSKP